MLKKQKIARILIGIMLGGICFVPKTYAMDPTTGVVQGINANATVPTSTTTITVGGNDNKTGLLASNTTGTNYTTSSDHSLTITNTAATVPTGPLDNYGGIIYAQGTGTGTAAVHVTGNVNFSVNLNAYADIAARGEKGEVTITGTVTGDSNSRYAALWANEGTLNLEAANINTLQTVVITGSAATNNAWGATATNNGNLNVAGNLTVNSTMDGGRGIQAANGGYIHIGSFTANVKGTVGMVAQYGSPDGINPGTNAGANIKVDNDVDITVGAGTGITAVGWLSNSGSTIDIGGNAKVNSTGSGTYYGISASGFAATGMGVVKVGGLADITTAGTGAHGIMLNSNSLVEAGSAKATTSGSSAYGVYVATATSTFNVLTGDTTINTSGSNADGIQIIYGKASVQNAKITTLGSGAEGISVYRGGASFTGKDVIVETSGSSAVGVLAWLGTVDVDNLKVTTNGNYAVGIKVYNNNSATTGKVTASSAEITTNGTYSAYGIEAYDNGTVEITGDTKITATGYGIYAHKTSVDGGIILTGDTTINTKATGVYAKDDSSVTMKSAYITTSDNSAHGIYVDNSTVKVTTGDTIINTVGMVAYGVKASNGAEVTLQKTNIATAKDYSAGVGVSGTNTKVSTTDLAVTTEGKAASGVDVSSEGKLTAKDSIITTNGAKAHGIYAYNNGSVTLDSANITTAGVAAHGINNLYNGTVTVANGGNVTASGADSYAIRSEGYYMDGRKPVTNVTGITASAPSSGIVISSEAAGEINAVNSSFVGNIQQNDSVANAGQTGDVDINFTNTKLTGATHALTTTSNLNMSMDSTSLWNVTANSDLNNFKNVGGTVDMVTPTSGAYETIEINHLAGTNGNYLMNSDLGSQTDGDKMIVHSSEVGAGGTVQVYDKSLVTSNMVVGEKKLLMIVDDNKTTQFTGARLHTGGLWDVDPTFERIGNDWYLVKVVKVQNTSTETILGDLEAGYGLWRGALTDDTLRKRLGDLRYNETEDGVWARMKAGKLTGPSFDSSYQMYQIGYDRRKDNNAYGIAVEHMRNRSSLTAGSGEDTMTGLALYATNYRSRDKFQAYSDIVLRADRLRGDMHSYGDIPDRLEYGTWAYSASYEYGKTYSDKKDKGYFIEPQGQLTYGYMRGGDYATDYGVKVKRAGIHSLVGRLGVVLGRRIHETDGKKDKSDYYLKANMYREFAGNGEIYLTTVNSYGDTEHVSHAGEHENTWYELGLGGNVRINPKTHVYGDVLKSFGGQINAKWQVNAGVRWEF